MKPSLASYVDAWRRHYGAPAPGEPDTKTRYVAQPQFVEWLESRVVKEWKAASQGETWFNRDSLPVHRSHQWPGAAAKISYRECVVTCSCQIVLFLSLTGTVLAYQIDFDEENPLGGAALTAMHLGRVIKRLLFGGETKMETIGKDLRRRGVLTA